MGTMRDAVVSAAPVRTKRRDTGDIICSAEWLTFRHWRRRRRFEVFYQKFESSAVAMVACVNAAISRATFTPAQAGVARKPQAAAIRTDLRLRELIASNSAHSVGAGPSVPAGASGVRRDALGLWGCVYIGAVRKQRAPGRRALRFVTAQRGSWRRPRARHGDAPHCSPASA